MTYQIKIIHPKAVVLLRDLAELGLISIEGENNGFPILEKQQKVTIDKDCVEKPEIAREEEFNFDNLPPITKSLAGSLKAPTKQKNRREAVNAQQKNYDRDDIPPIVKSMLGAFESTDDFDYKDELTKALVEKYL